MALIENFSTPQVAPTKPFVVKSLNIMDALLSSNNLGRSVSRANFLRIRRAFAHGAKTLAAIMAKVRVCLQVGGQKCQGNNGTRWTPQWMSSQLVQSEASRLSSFLLLLILHNPCFDPPSFASLSCLRMARSLSRHRTTFSATRGMRSVHIATRVTRLHPKATLPVSSRPTRL